MSILTATEIAKLRGISRESASRWLRALEAEYGETVVGWHGNKRFTSHEALAKVSPGLSREHMYAPRIAELQEALSDESKRVDQLCAELAKLRSEVARLTSHLEKRL